MQQSFPGMLPHSEERKSPTVSLLSSASHFPTEGDGDGAGGTVVAGAGAGVVTGAGAGVVIGAGAGVGAGAAPQHANCVPSSVGQQLL